MSRRKPCGPRRRHTHTIYFVYGAGPLEAPRPTYAGDASHARAARVNITSILQNLQAELPGIYATELEKEAR